MRFIAPVVLALNIALTAPALPGDAELTAHDYASIPPGTVFKLQCAADTELNEFAEQQATTALSALGYSVGEEASLILTIEVQPVDPAEFADPQSGPVQLRASGKSVVMRFKLWDTADQGLLQITEPDPTRVPSPHFVNMTIHDPASGRIVWRGRIFDSDGGGDPFDDARRMVFALVRVLGQTAQGKAVDVE